MDIKTLEKQVSEFMEEQFLFEYKDDDVVIDYAFFINLLDEYLDSSSNAKIDCGESISYLHENKDVFLMILINYIKKFVTLQIERDGDKEFLDDIITSLENIISKKFTDPFLEDIVCANRLIKEWNEHGKIIVAFDFDGTVFDYLGTGSTHEKVIGLLKEIQNDAHIYCFSARNEEDYNFLESQIKEKDILCDGINIDYDFIKFRGRKPYYNILLDDRSGLSSAKSILEYAFKYKD